MGQVHLAWDPLLRRQIALKRLLNADPMLALRFMGEAQAQAKVEHPRICKVFEVSSEAGQPYIAMQYVAGLTLGEARDQLPAQDKARIMAEVAGAIHAAHRTGLVHRDLKPSNILLELQEDGGWVPYILDFGLARDQAMADLTLSWGLVGTPAFMSPEQARAEEPSPASDIYSLGATFYALFAGHPPYEATTLVGLINQQATRSIRPLRRLQSGFSRDLDTILLKCLEPEPRSRYASASDLEQDLRRWLAGEPIRARAIGPLGRGWRRIKRQRALSAAIGAGLVLALGLLAWNIQAGRRAQTQVELAQRFVLQVREVEQLLRIERMLPTHDIRPAEAQVRQRMEEIRGTMARLGAVSQGPGRYALGRGHLALREYHAAQEELERAWDAGYRSPELAYSLGTTLMERYLAEVVHLPPADGAGHEALRLRYVVKALARFRQAKGLVQEDPGFGEAQVAMLEKDYLRCVDRCRTTFAGKPWMYEAKLLEATAWMARGSTAVGTVQGPRLSPKEGYEALEESRKAIDAALAIAPSDERIHAAEFNRVSTLSLLQSDGGTPDTAIFDRAERLFPLALAIRPDNLELKHQWLYDNVRHGFALLREGADVRPLMRETLARAQADPQFQGQAPNPSIGNLHWLLADGQWRRGEDPLAELAAMELCYQPEDLAQVQPACIKAEFLASRGRDPLPVLQRAEGILERLYPDIRKLFYPFTVWGTVLLARADWEWQTGIDPLPTLERAVQRLEEGYRLNPGVVYPCFFLGQIHQRRALRAMALGRDPGPELKAGLDAVQRGLAIADSHYRLHLALAELRDAQAQDLLRRDLDATQALAQARAALAAGLKINPTDFRLHCQGAAVEFTAARQALAQGRSPLEALGRAEACARAGLRFKADHPRLWLALARVGRMRAQWAMRSGGSGAAELAAGLRDLRRSLAINPGLAEAQAERAILEGLGGADPAGPRAQLAACLKRNPFLNRDTLDF